MASRRLRELLPLLPLDPDERRLLERRLRKVTDQLGTVRELDVLMALVEELQGTSRFAGPAVERIHAAAHQARARSRVRLAAKLSGAQLRRLAGRLERVERTLQADEAAPRGGGPHGAWLWALDARIARRAESAHAAIEAAGALYAPDHLHRVRIGIKKLRYATELAAEARGRRATADILRLKAAQDLLGRLHDLDVLLAYARRMQASLAPPTMAGWREFERLIQELEDECRRLHAAYVADRGALVATVDRMRGPSRQRRSAALSGAIGPQ